MGNVPLLGAVCLQVVFLFLCSVGVSHPSLTLLAIVVYIHVIRNCAQLSLG